MKSGNILLGVLAGVAVGALAGILFAPEKGSTTRKQILRKGENYADGLKEKFDELLNTVKEKYETVSQEIEDIPYRGKSKSGEAVKENKNGNA